MCERLKIGGVEKLVPNLHHKRNYVIHIRALDQALKHGLIPDRIHQVIEFYQSAWMKSYIDFNTTQNSGYKRFQEGFLQINE